MWVKKPGIGLPSLFVRTHPVPTITDDANGRASRIVSGAGMLWHQSLEFAKESCYGIAAAKAIHLGPPPKNLWRIIAARFRLLALFCVGIGQHLAAGCREQDGSPSGGTDLPISIPKKTGF